MALTQVDQGLLGTNAQYTGFKNRLINSAMVIDQRNAGASVTQTSANALYPVDRFAIYGTVSSKFTAQQNAGSVTPPAGFTKYLGITSSAATSLAAGDYYRIYQSIEGLNLFDIAYGTASAATITLSFWVRSSLTGTFGGSLFNPNASRSYPFSYTISSANTWEQKTITVAGDTAGAIATDNTTGFLITWGLGVGSTYGSGTAGAWASGNIMAPTGATSVVGTLNATFYITGVQLEKGSTATSFDYRPYGTELQLCQRYYETSYPIGTIPGNPGSAIESNCVFGVKTTSYILTYLSYKVPKRASASLVFYDNAGNINKCTRDDIASSSSDNQVITSQSGTTNGTQVYSSGTFNATGIVFNYTASAEL